MAKRAKTQKRETEFQIFNFEKIKIQINQFQVYFQYFFSRSKETMIKEQELPTGTAPHLYYYCPIDYVVLSSAGIAMMCIHSTKSQLMVCCSSF